MLLIFLGAVFAVHFDFVSCFAPAVAKTHCANLRCGIILPSTVQQTQGRNAPDLLLLQVSSLLTGAGLVRKVWKRTSLLGPACVGRIGKQAPDSLATSASNIKVALFYAAASSLALGIASGPVFDKFLMDMGHSNAFVGSIESLAGLTALLSALPVGFLVDSHSRVHMVRIGGVITFVAAVISAAAIATKSRLGICVGLVVGGVALELVMSAAGALFTDSVPQGSRGAAFTQRDMIQSLASASAPLLVAACACKRADWSVPAMQRVLVLGNLALIPATLLVYLFKDPATELSDNGNKEQTRAPTSRLVPYIIATCDFITCIGAGMTCKFFSLFFIEDYHFSPTQINLLMGVYPLTIAFFMRLLRRISVVVGRAQVSFCAFALNGLLFLVLARVQSLPLLLAVFLIRGGLSNATAPIDRSILMDFTPSSSRGRWNAVSSLASATWSGSAFIGGFLSDAHGYRWTFFVTGFIYFGSCLLYLPLLWLVPRKE